ncbi:MarR family winged helix-turn-helix transcriptional regulator [Sciscionella sediminilitoris]|uniref:MarR family winged helix-turn-helix transcriptional regulator n=1 Tax=Sciscionella sediminilitoris TaxID=1445613 RepID=UPI0004DECDB2|nr:MarR family winged helix-turn-helix transcriptional regulator [Sciscionella sp. SE31]
MFRKGEEPIGRTVGRVSRAIARGFDEALNAAGGSFSTWIVLLELKLNPGANQRALAAEIGIEPATLTHHLNGMERSGLITRRRDPANRRVHIVELTEAGEARFAELAEAAREFDARVRSGFSAAEIGSLRALLGRLCANIDAEDTP